MFDVIKVYLKKDWKLFFLTLAFSMAAMMFSIFSPQVISRILNGKNELAFLTGIFIAQIVIICTNHFLDVFLPNWIGTKMNKNIIMQILHEKMELFHSKNAIDNFYAGNNMTYFVPFFFIVELPELLIAMAASVIIIIELILTAKTIGFICIIYVAFHMSICLWVLGKQELAEKKLTKSDNHYKSTLRQMYLQIPYEIQFSMQERMISKAKQVSEETCAVYRKNVVWEVISKSQDFLFRNVLFLIAVIVIVTQPSGEYGTYEIVLSYTTLLLSNVERFFEVMEIYKMAKAMYDTFTEGQVGLEDNGEEKVTDISKISFQNVSFGFPQNLLIDKMSLSIERGKTYVIKGKNGKGKTTFINLLCGIYHPIDGDVYLNMTKGESVDWCDFRREHLSFVDQKDELLYDSLTEEITGKTEELSLKEKQVFENIIRYLKLENIDENLDKGKLSGGERKKINLARFMYEVEMQNREVVVLDEPTNHIDIQTKKKFLEYLKKMTDRIVIVISHDDDVISCADEVIAF